MERWMDWLSAWGNLITFGGRHARSSPVGAGPQGAQQRTCILRRYGAARCGSYLQVSSLLRESTQVFPSSELLDSVFVKSGRDVGKLPSPRIPLRRTPSTASRLDRYWRNLAATSIARGSLADCAPRTGKSAAMRQKPASMCLPECAGSSEHSWWVSLVRR